MYDCGRLAAKLVLEHHFLVGMREANRTDMNFSSSYLDTRQ
jgi:hypothetical protein